MEFPERPGVENAKRSNSEQEEIKSMLNRLVLVPIKF